MQTFLPYHSFTESAKVLDWRRLGKQRVETKQILTALESGGGWANHPATKMWAGCEVALALYGISICQEWISRGYKDSLLPFFLDKYTGECVVPKWLGDDKFHSSHRSNLLRKDPIWYGQFGWSEPDSLVYTWGN